MSVLSGQVLTVLGFVHGDQLGQTLPHEHVLVWNTSWWIEPEEVSRRAFAHARVTIENLGRIKRDPLLVRDNLILSDIDVAIKELRQLKQVGGSTLVDVTNRGLGRDPDALAAIARETNLNIVMGSGYYVCRTHPQDMDERRTEELTEEIVKDIMEGVGPNRIRAGIIGEIGTSDPIHPNEVKNLQAAAKAQQITGAAIAVHTAQLGRTGLEVLDILEKEGADLTRVVICHLDQKHPLQAQLEYHKEIERRGAYVEYDVWGCEWDFASFDEGVPSDHDRVLGFIKLAEAGYLEHLLASHDVCTKTQLQSYGGYGYSHLLVNGAALLRRAGFSRDELETIFVENPKRMLQFP